MFELKDDEDYSKKFTQDDWGGHMWDGPAG
jgi:hypothetical protein